MVEVGAEVAAVVVELHLVVVVALQAQNYQPLEHLGQSRL